MSSGKNRDTGFQLPVGTVIAISHTWLDLFHAMQFTFLPFVRLQEYTHSRVMIGPILESIASFSSGCSFEGSM